MANSSASPANQSMPETSSSCLTQSLTAAHNFEVINFSLLQGIGVGKIVSSRTFSVGGYDWCINLYPDGRTQEDSAYVSAFLLIQGGGAGARAKFSLSILGKGGQVLQLDHASHTFGSSGGLGWDKFIKRSGLRPLLRLNNDCFTIRCVLTVITSPRVVDVAAIVVPQSNALQDFAHMLKDEEGSDVTFRVGDQLFAAHRCVLAARSAVFKPPIFEALLHFIYTDSLPDNFGASNNVLMQHLLVAADRYGLDRLRLMCEAKLCRTIDARTVATTLALAEQHHCIQLKSACLKFIASRGELGTVMETGGFTHLAASCPLVVLEILDKIASQGIC
ncbi:hypothetical protein ACP70R_010351 [Stipagrostis hirtigluma subsp. patula]